MMRTAPAWFRSRLASNNGAPAAPTSLDASATPEPPCPAPPCPPPSGPAPVPPAPCPAPPPCPVAASGCSGVELSGVPPVPVVPLDPPCPPPPVFGEFEDVHASASPALKRTALPIADDFKSYVLIIVP